MRRISKNTAGNDRAAHDKRRDAHSIMTVDGARNDYEETLLDEFAHYWAGSIDGQSHGPYPWYEAYFKEYGGK